MKRYGAYLGSNTTMGALAREQSDGDWFNVAEVKKAFGFYDEVDMEVARREFEEEKLKSDNTKRDAIAQIVQSMEDIYSKLNTNMLIPIVPIVKEWIEQLNAVIAQRAHITNI